ncbi:MAG: hypothetical protein Kow0059_01580 [Candidatus Sumerlaeia bacterium]
MGEDRFVAGTVEGQLSGWRVDAGGRLHELWQTGSGGNRLTGLAAEDGLIAAALFDQGVAVFAGDGATTPAPVAMIQVSGFALDVALHGAFVYVAAGFDGLLMFDLSTPGSPQPAGQIQTAGFTERVRRSGHWLFLGEGADGLAIFDAPAPGQLSVYGQLMLSGRIEDFAGSGDRLAVAAGESGLGWFDISAPGSPVLLDWWAAPACVRTAVIRDGVFGGGWSLTFWRRTPEDRLLLQARIGAGGSSAAALSVVGGRVVTGTFDGVLSVHDLSGRMTPQPALRLSTGRSIEQFAVNEAWLAGIGPRNHLWIFLVSEQEPSIAFVQELIGHNWTAAALDGDALLAADADRALEFFRFDPRTGRFELEWSETARPGNAADFARDSDRLFTAARSWGLRVYSLSGPIPVITAELSSPIALDQLVLTPRALFGRTQFGGIVCFERTGGQGLRMDSQIYPWHPIHISAHGDFLFVARRRYGVDIWDFSRIDEPRLAGRLFGQGEFDARMTLPVNESLALVADGPLGAAVVDWSDPEAPRLMCHLVFEDGAPVLWIARHGGRVALSSAQEVIYLPADPFFPQTVFHGDQWLIK